MYYKLKSARIDGNNRIFVTVADSNIRPLRYFKSEYQVKDENPLLVFFRNIAEGEIRPLGSCSMNGRNLADLAKNMFTLKQKAGNINISDDMHTGLNMTGLLNKKLAEIAVEWFLNNCNDITEDDCDIIKSLDREAVKKYKSEKTRAKANGVIYVRAAVISSLFEDYDAFVDEDNRMFIGLKKDYDNHGHYDNSGCTAIYLQDEPDEDIAGALFSFFGNGYIKYAVDRKIDIDWLRICGIPGYAVAKTWYEKELANRTN